jgi:hypothetical protein
MVRSFCGLSDRTKTVVTDLPDYSAEGIPSPIHLPSLPALTTLVIHLSGYGPSLYLTNVLCSIGSASALTSIFIEHRNWNRIENPLEGHWVDVDRWLSRIAKRAKVNGGLTLTLKNWPEGKSVWEGFFLEFMESGGGTWVDRSMWRRGSKISL